MIGSVESSEISRLASSALFVTVLFVDRVVEAHQERQRRNYRNIALKSLGVPLRRHFGFLCTMLKVSVTKEPDSVPATLGELFGHEYAKALARLDFSKPFGAGVVWADEAHNEFQFFLTALTRCLDKYAVYLESELVAVVEGILTSDMVGFAGHFRNLVYQRMVPPSLFADASVAPVIRQYTHQFVALAEAYNNVTTEDRLKIRSSSEMWRRDVMPAMGSAASPL